MKKLSQVTKDDAIAILSASEMYKNFFLTGRWKLTDETEEIREPCKRLHSKYSLFMFWFTEDSIDINRVDDSFDSVWYDVKYVCYLKAHELGYFVPKLSDLLNDIKK